jgi:hypothetical protein
LNSDDRITWTFKSRFADKNDTDRVLNVRSWRVNKVDNYASPTEVTRMMIGKSKPFAVDVLEYPSGRQPSKKYNVTVFSDFSFMCTCPGYIIRGVNNANLAYECKHIKDAKMQPSVADAFKRAAGAIPVRMLQQAVADKAQYLVTDSGNLQNAEMKQFKPKQKGGTQPSPKRRGRGKKDVDL